MTTVQDLMDATRERADIVNDQSVDDTELLRLVLGSCAFLDSEIIALNEDYTGATFYSVLAAGRSHIPLPASFLKLRRVQFNGGPTGSTPPEQITAWYNLYSFQLSELSRWSSPLSVSSWPYAFPQLAVRVWDNALLIDPEQYAQGAYRIFYVPKFPSLQPADNLPTHMQLQMCTDWAVANAAGKIMTKFGRDPSGFFMEQDRYLASIQKAFKNRDASSPKKIANTRFGMDPFMMGGGFDR